MRRQRKPLHYDREIHGRSVRDGKIWRETVDEYRISNVISSRFVEDEGPSRRIQALRGR